MSVIDFLSFIGQLRKLSDIPSKIENIGKIFHLESFMNLPISKLKAQRQHVGLAQRLSTDLRWSSLTRPLTLDPNQRQEFKNYLKNKPEEQTAFVATNLLEEAQQYCQRFIILSEGKIVKDISLDQLQKRGQLESLFKQVTLGK